ncbi:MAG TPA: hypothetical protein VJ957_05515 [Longimicrobiales bacterium]|nr:hypothetical protein [Longimicrobiales bacterium]
MRRLVFSLVLVLASTAFAQQSAELSGIVKSEHPLPDGTRVAIHVVDNNNVWGLEVASVAPVGGTFKITAKPIPKDQLRPFLGGAVLLPGLQNEYTVKAASGSDQVDFAVGRINMYVDKNGNGVFDRVTDPWFIGVPSLEKPVGFFSLLYVDRDCVLTGGGSELHLKQGWNVFTVRFPGDKPVYAVQPAVNDIVLDVFLP